MEAVTLIVPHGYDLEVNAKLPSAGDVSRGGSDPFAVESGGARVYVVQNPHAFEELDPEGLRQIRSVIPDPVFYSVDYSDLDLCERVLVALADDAALLVDNDHGVVLSGAAFVEEIRARPGWDWRSEE